MRRLRPKTIVLLAATAAFAALVAVGIAARERILEEWYAHVLESGSEEEKLRAAEKLAEMGSGRAVQWLLEEAKNQCERDFDRGGMFLPRPPYSKRGKQLQDILVRTGMPAMPTLIRATARALTPLKSMEGLAKSIVAESVLHEMEPDLWRGPTGLDVTEPLRRLMEDSSRPSEFRKAAAEALRELEHSVSAQEPPADS